MQKRTLILRIRKKDMRNFLNMMKKDGFTNLKLTGHIKAIKGRGRQWVIYLTRMCKWIAEGREGRITMGKMLLGTARDRRLWGAIITHVLKRHTEDKD